MVGLRRMRRWQVDPDSSGTTAADSATGWNSSFVAQGSLDKPREPLRVPLGRCARPGEIESSCGALNDDRE